ncbi:MAG: hypothetical protein KF690_07390 [Bacteroidetes bacterium]|nr:hypothetical protein [Bacteroidota bacterium]
MYAWLEQLLLDEYAFTFLVTALSVVFKAMTTGERAVLQRRETYDLGVEFVFIAISFGLSNLAEINRERQMIHEQLVTLSDAGNHAMLAVRTSLLPQGLEQSLNSQLIQMELTSSALWVIVCCLCALLMLMVVMIRTFGRTDEQKPDLWRGIILPNLMGIIAVVLVMAHIYEIK